jgi:repressor LexA
MLEGPSPRQLDVLRFISASVVSRGFPPTIRELCTKLDITSTNTVAGHLLGLVKKGLIEREPNASRGVRITRRGLWYVGRAA